MEPIRASKGKSVAQTIQDSIDYILNPKKTRNGELTDGYECDTRTAATEFLMSKQEYFATTGRRQRKKDVLLYHMRQSFKPGEISPEDAAKIGYELALRWTKGKHAFVVAAHEDKEHIHCHIIFNSTNTDCTRKFINFWGSSFALRRLSDMICLENGLSIVKDPKPSKGHYGTWLGDKKKPSQREHLEQLIDKVLADKPPSFEDFIKLLEAENCEFNPKRRSVRLGEYKGFHKLKSLSDGYTEAAIRERIAGERPAPPKKEATTPRQRKFGLLIDVQNSIKAQNSPGYERWAKVFSLKQAAKTLIFLQDNKLDDIQKLGEAAQKAKDDFNALQTRIHAADARLKEISVLQKHIGTYIKTKDIYAQYKKSKFSKKFRAANEKAITDCKAAKAYFDEQKLEKLPTINMLRQEYAALTAEKKKLYSGYNTARSHMHEILTAKQNVERLLNYRDPEETKEYRREGR